LLWLQLTDEADKVAGLELGETIMLQTVQSLRASAIVKVTLRRRRKGRGRKTNY
jgi:hypothetical protein